MTNLSHGLCDIAGWTLILFCFFSPSSRWQSISFSSVYLILLSGIHWKKYLSIYQGINAYVLIAIFLLWLAVSALTYLFLSRRQQLQRQQD
jgi:membrane glycosyltransferase